MKCRWEERAPLRHMIIDRRRANPILHLIQLIVLEYGCDLLLDRREARRLSLFKTLGLFKNSDLVRTRAYHLMFCSSVVEIIARSKGT